MGVYQDKNKKWFVNKSWTDNYGQRHFKTKRGFKYKRDALAYENNLIYQINHGLNVTDDPIFADYFKNWVQTYKVANTTLRPNTVAEYQLDSQRLSTGLGKLPIKKITRIQYQTFINTFGSTHAKSTVRKLNNHIRSCVRHAIDDGLIYQDFTRNISLTFNPKHSQNVTYLEEQQIKKLLHYLIQHRNPSYSSNYMIITIMYTGLRESEAAGLTWDCVDFNNLTLNINKAWDYKHHNYGPTKNLSSKRIIGISPKLANYLKELKNNHPSKVFWSKAHHTLPQSRSLIDTLRRALNKVNISAPGVHIHSLRHSQVAILLNANISTYDIAKRLGHSDTTITERVYAYEFKKHQAIVNKKINTALDNI